MHASPRGCCVTLCICDSLLVLTQRTPCGQTQQTGRGLSAGVCQAVRPLLLSTAICWLIASLTGPSARHTLRLSVLCFVALATTFSSTGRPLRRLTASIRRRARLAGPPASVPNSSSSSSVVGTKKGSTWPGWNKWTCRNGAERLQSAQRPQPGSCEKGCSEGRQGLGAEAQSPLSATLRHLSTSFQSIRLDCCCRP